MPPEPLPPDLAALHRECARGYGPMHDEVVTIHSSELYSLLNLLAAHEKRIAALETEIRVIREGR